MATESLLTVTQAAKQLGLSSVRVRQFCQEGRLGQKVGPLWMIQEKELRQFAKKSRPPGGRREKSPN